MVEEHVKTSVRKKEKRKTRKTGNKEEGRGREEIDKRGKRKRRGADE